LTGGGGGFTLLDPMRHGRVGKESLGVGFGLLLAFWL